MCHGFLSGRGEGGILSREAWTLNAFSCEASTMVAWFCCVICIYIWNNLDSCMYTCTYITQSWLVPSQWRWQYNETYYVFRHFISVGTARKSGDLSLKSMKFGGFRGCKRKRQGRWALLRPFQSGLQRLVLEMWAQTVHPGWHPGSAKRDNSYSKSSPKLPRRDLFDSNTLLR